jgi:transposase
MLIQIPLDIPDVEIEKPDTSSKKGFVLTIISTLNGTICKCYGKPIDKFHGYSKEIALRHLPRLDKTVWLKIKPKKLSGKTLATFCKS